MRRIARRILLCSVAALVFPLAARAQDDPDAPPPSGSAQTSNTFRWIDFHAQKDQNIVVWVTRSLQVDKWTAIREIGVVYDAALVVTSTRANPQAPPTANTFTIYSVSLTSHVAAPLVTGVNLRWFERVHFADGAPEEWPVLYDNCRDCAQTAYFTAFYYDLRAHAWGARWVKGGQGVPVWNSEHPAKVQWSQYYGVIASPDGHVALYTWNHFEHDKDPVPANFITRYDLDPITFLERATVLTARQDEGLEPKLCRGQDAVQDLQRGQDSTVCKDILGEHPTRKPVTTPPGNNRGQSLPPGRRR